MNADDRTRGQIERMLNDIAEASRSRIDEVTFCHQCLSLAVTALAAHGGVFWRIRDRQTTIVAENPTPWWSSLATDEFARLQHEALVVEVVTRQATRAILPGAALDPLSNSRLHLTDAQSMYPLAWPMPLKAHNSSPHLLLFAPIQCGHDVCAVLEIFQRVGARPATQRGYLRFLDQIGEFASDYFTCN